MTRWEVTATVRMIVEAETEEEARPFLRNIIRAGAESAHWFAGADNPIHWSVRDDLKVSPVPLDLSWCPESLHGVFNNEHGQAIADKVEEGRAAAVVDKTIPGCHFITGGNYCIRVAGDPLPSANSREVDVRAAFGHGVARAEAESSATVYAHQIGEGHGDLRMRRIGAGHYDSKLVTLVETATPGATWMGPVVGAESAAIRMLDGKAVGALMPCRVDVTRLQEVSP